MFVQPCENLDIQKHVCTAQFICEQSYKCKEIEYKYYKYTSFNIM